MTAAPSTARVGFRRDALVGKAHELMHSLRFDRAAFPTKRSVRSWLPLNGFRLSNIIETPEKWIVRCGPATVPSPDHWIQYAPGVEAVVGMPPDMVGKVKIGFSASSIAHPGATGPSNHTPEMPDFKSIYAQPEAQARQAQEAKQSESRRRSTWLDLNFNGLHGNPGSDRPELKYIDGKSSTGDAAIIQPRLVLSAKELKASQDRVKSGFIMGYDVTRTGKKR
ncbi:MAG: hypothetical protein O7G84_19380 [Gammaproteobacteria bacterium]|nr:hypothetical protein [Gammaproteobacteria bacterium]